MPEISEKDRLLEKMLDLASRIKSENDPQKLALLLAQLNEALKESMKYQKCSGG